MGSTINIAVYLNDRSADHYFRLQESRRRKLRGMAREAFKNGLLEKDE